MANVQELSRLLKDLSAWLRYQKRLGVEWVPGSSAASYTEDPFLKKIGEAKDLHNLKELLKNCTRCPLHEGRKNIVFGEGDPSARLVAVGEAPGREEDLTGRPFIGPSGELLTKMLKAIQIQRQKIFITSVVKCRPPRNRTPHADELRACRPILFRQIEIIKPAIILALGQTAVQAIIGTSRPLKELRGKVHQVEGIKVIATYHPAFLLRFRGDAQKSFKKRAWEDLKLLRAEYEKVV